MAQAGFTVLMLNLCSCIPESYKHLLLAGNFFFSTESEKCMGGIPPRGTRLLGAPVAWTGCAMCGYDILDL